MNSIDGSASRNATLLSVKRKNMGGGNVSAGGFSNKRSNRQSNVFEARGFNKIGAEPTVSLPPSGSAGSRFSQMNTKNVPVLFDPTGANYSQANERAPLGGNPAVDNGRLNATFLGRGNQPPKFGTDGQNFASWRLNEEGLPVISGFPEFKDWATRGQTFANRGTDPIMNGAPPKPDYFDSYNPPGGNSLPNSMRGSDSTNLFINQSAGTAADRAIQKVDSDPFQNYPFDDAARKVSTSSQDGVVNPISKIAMLVTNEASAYMETEQFNHAMFISLDIAKNIKENKGSNHLGLDRPMAMHSLFSLPVVNFLMHAAQKFPTSLDKVMTPQRMLASFGFIGICISEMGAKDTRFAMNSSSSAIARLINLQFMGETKVYNYWDCDETSYGHWVGFILKGVSVTDIYAQNSQEIASYNIDAADPNKVEAIVAPDGVRMSENPLQYIPWRDRLYNNRIPSDEELAYIDDYGVQRKGVYIEVGVITDVYQKRDSSIAARSPFSANASLHCGSVRINLHMKRGCRV